MDEIDALVQKQIESDSEFQLLLADMTDEEKEVAVVKKSKEVLAQEVKKSHDEAKKNAEVADNYKVRAEKAEKAAPKEKKEDKKEDKDDLTLDDMYTLLQANVPGEDLEEVNRMAKVLNKPIAEAINDDLVQGALQKRAEERTTAAATDTGGGTGGVHTVTGDQVLAEANKGNMPEPGSKEAELLHEARMKAKLG